MLAIARLSVLARFFLSFNFAYVREGEKIRACGEKDGGLVR